MADKLVVYGDGNSVITIYRLSLLSIKGHDLEELDRDENTQFGWS